MDGHQTKAVKGPCLNHLTNGPYKRADKAFIHPFFGSGKWTRTTDKPGMNRILYQLSYAAKGTPQNRAFIILQDDGSFVNRYFLKMQILLRD